VKQWRRKVDKRMKRYGDIDEEKKVIRVNPRKRDLLNTVIHEELHRRFPNMTEKDVTKKSKEIEGKLTIKKAIQLLKKYA